MGHSRRDPFGTGTADCCEPPSDDRHGTGGSLDAGSTSSPSRRSRPLLHPAGGQRRPLVDSRTASAWCLLQVVRHHTGCFGPSSPGWDNSDTVLFYAAHLGLPTTLDLV